MKKKNIKEIVRIMNEVRKKKKTVYSNYYYSYNASDVLFDVLKLKETIVFGIQELEIYRVFYYSCNVEELTEALSEMPKGAITDIIEKKEITDTIWLDSSGFKQISVYGRFGGPCASYKEQKAKFQKSKIDIFYDEAYGKCASEEDLGEIQKLIMNNFDFRTDHLFTDEQMLQLIRDNLVYVEKEEGNIICIVIYRIEGKKLYFNLTYNRGTADISYSIEKKILLQSIRDYGVNYTYGWIAMTNKKALKRSSFSYPHLFNYIYQKK